MQESRQMDGIHLLNYSLLSIFFFSFILSCIIKINRDLYRDNTSRKYFQFYFDGKNFFKLYFILKFSEKARQFGQTLQNYDSFFKICLHFLFSVYSQIQYIFKPIFEKCTFRYFSEITQYIIISILNSGIFQDDNKISNILLSHLKLHEFL